MLIELWLDQSVLVIFLCLALVLAASVLVLAGATALLRRTGGVGHLTGVVAPFFGAVSVLFGLMAGFAANDAWDRGRQATRAIHAERDALVAINELSIATVSDMAPIRAAIRDYLSAVVTDEWPRLHDGETSPKASAALATLLRELADPKIGPEAGPAPQTALLTLWQRARSARSDRLALSEQFSDHARWWTVLCLAVLTQAALALVHIDKPKAQLAALLLFSVAALVTLGMVAVKERPFDGPLALEPTAFREALAAMPPSGSVPP